MMSITDFLKYELYPALWDRIDEAFPSMSFRKKGSKWISPYHLNGEKAKSDYGSYISEQYHNRIADANGSCSMSLLDYKAKEMGYADGVQGAAFLEVVKALADVCKIELPQGEDTSSGFDSYRNTENRQAKLHSIAEKMRRALFDDEGKETLQYLKEVRGYSEEEIKQMGLGHLTAEAEEELFQMRLIGYKNDKTGEWCKGYTSRNYKLAIPYTAGGTIHGFKFRLLKTEINQRTGESMPKYRNTNGLSKKESFFGLTGTKLNTADREKDITIVEGELDALRAQAAGLPYVVAATGSSISPEALEELKRKGATRVTLLFDTEERGSTAEQQASAKINNALNLIRQAGLRGYVQTFPSDDGGKVDMDTFLKSNTTGLVKEMIENAIPAPVWLFHELLRKTEEAQEVEGESSFKAFDRLKEKTIALINNRLICEADRKLILQEFEAATEGVIEEEDIKAEADRIKAITEREENAARSALLLTDTGKRISDFTEAFRSKKNSLSERIASAQTDEEKKALLSELQTFLEDEAKQLQSIEEDVHGDALRAKQERTLKAIISEAQRLTEAGKMEDALSMMKKASDVKKISREGEFAEYLKDDIEALFEEYKTPSKGITTDIRFTLGKDVTPLFLPSGAITIIGAYTGHGKSKVLQSLAINTATKYKDGSVLFITYEESRKNVNMQLLNAYCNLTLTQETGKFGNLQTLREYLEDGNIQHIRQSSFSSFREKLKEFKELRSSSLKLIKPDDNTLGTLLGLLSYSLEHSEKPVVAVFIDYVNELYLTDGERKQSSRTDELKEIMVEIDLIAQNADLPIVMGAQLKRGENGSDSPLSLNNQALADSTWIEKKASEIILLWSNKEKPFNDPEGKKLKKIEEGAGDAKQLKEIGFRIDKENGGQIYAVMTKSRYGLKNAASVLSIDGNTGRVWQQEPVKTKPISQQDRQPQQPQFQLDLVKQRRKPKQTEKEEIANDYTNLEARELDETPF